MKQLMVENDLITFELEDGLIIGTFNSEFIDFPMVDEITKIRLELQKGEKYPLISNIRKVKNSTKEARDFMASRAGCEGVIAAAILIDSGVASMIGNFFTRISKPLVPTRLFTDEKDAKKWLAKYIAQI